MKFKAFATADVTGKSDSSFLITVVNDHVFYLFYLDWFCHTFPGEVKDAEHFQYGEETMLKWKEGRLSADITEEHRKPSDAVVIF